VKVEGKNVSPRKPGLMTAKERIKFGRKRKNKAKYEKDEKEK